MDIFHQLPLLQQRSSQTRIDPQVSIVQDITGNHPTIISDMLQFYPTIHPYYPQEMVQMPHQHRQLLDLENNNNRDKPTTTRTTYCN
jgi:hypothetical protein